MEISFEDCYVGISLRTADAYPVVTFSSSIRGREAMTGNASAVRRLCWYESLKG